mgnify:CR=1 FL=1
MRLYGNDPIRFCRNKGHGGELGTKTKNPNHMIQGARRISRKKMQTFGPA